MRPLSASWPCMTSLYQRHNSIASIDGVSCCEHTLLFLRFYSSMHLSVSWPCMTSLYQRHNSIVSVLLLGSVYGKYCISRILFWDWTEIISF